MTRTGVLLTAFGGPGSMDEVATFCASLMGREPSPEVIERVQLRYLTIGGASPLPEIVGRIAEKLGEGLAKRKMDVPVAVGMRYSSPSIADGLAALVANGVDRVVTLSLAPFESPHSSGAYRDAVLRAAALLPDVTIVEAPAFGELPAFIDALGQAAGEALADIAPGRNAVLFTAHSLPVDEIAGSPYVESLQRTAGEVARKVGMQGPARQGVQQWLEGVDAFGSKGGGVPWLLAYQSRGQRGGEWLGPDVLDVVRTLRVAGFEGVVFAPIGFATDHLETVYDLDVEASGLAFDLDMEYERARVPNDSAEMIAALLEVVLPIIG